MDTSLRYFLVVAEELNISHAAQALRVSQQSLSQHMKKLEEKYNVELFARKPHLSLTSSGVVLRDIASKIQVLENSLFYELDSIRSDFQGVLNVGITNSRANILMPEVLRQFNEVYPNISIHLWYSSSENLATKLTRGFVDVYIGLGTDVQKQHQEHISSDLLNHECPYLVVSEKLLQKYQIGHDMIAAHTQDSGVDLSIFEEIPFLNNQSDEQLYSIYFQYFQEHGIQFKSISYCNDSALRIKMCGNNLGASLVLEPFLIHAVRHNQISPNNPLYYFKVSNLIIDSKIAYYSTDYLPQYLRFFINVVKEQSKNMTLEHILNA